MLPSAIQIHMDNINFEKFSFTIIFSKTKRMALLPPPYGLGLTVCILQPCL